MFLLAGIFVLGVIYAVPAVILLLLKYTGVAPELSIMWWMSVLSGIYLVIAAFATYYFNGQSTSTSDQAAFATALFGFLTIASFIIGGLSTVVLKLL